MNRALNALTSTRWGLQGTLLALVLIALPCAVQVAHPVTPMTIPAPSVASASPKEVIKTPVKVPPYTRFSVAQYQSLRPQLAKQFQLPPKSMPAKPVLAPTLAGPGSMISIIPGTQPGPGQFWHGNPVEVWPGMMRHSAHNLSDPVDMVFMVQDVSAGAYLFIAHTAFSPKSSLNRPAQPKPVPGMLLPGKANHRLNGKASASYYAAFNDGPGPGNSDARCPNA